ncbi:high nitrogen upregulated cytochrome P450 monooxygenase 2 [Roridomyces roridus]|uniref:High nitrogen upregulated cytochrome P450 monooxygenase 2 n=1 Tax=Roridomyces roridus TaxID=1738132 RepID=A0AAD7BXH9_9AGAR|nr:high nitrogen upregulated cytochrome P450 monooxygenase 2 [Roridomyces roridus]
MDSFLLSWAISLGLLNHLYFHKYEPQSAKFPLLFLFLEPAALVLCLGGPISFLRVLLSSTVFWGSLSLSIVLYRLSPFHPLAQYPGPTICKVTKLWGAALAVRGKQYLYLEKLHDTYGPTRRTLHRRRGRCFSDIRYWRTCQGTVKFVMTVWSVYEGGRNPSTPPTIASMVGEAHAKRRRVWNRAMASLRDYDPLIQKRVAQLLARLGEQPKGTAVNLELWFELFTFDFMGDLAFGGVFEMLQQGKDTDGLGNRIRSYMEASAILGPIPWIFGLLDLIPMVGRMVKEFNDLGQGLATRRIESGAIHTKDLWYHIASLFLLIATPIADEEGHEKQKPTLQDATSDGITAIIAASDTTAHLLTSMIWCLISNPECYKRVQQEIDDMFVVEDDLVDFSKHQQCAFLSACVNEALRLFPPLPVNGTRQVHLNSGGGRNIAGKYIPEGTSVYTPPYVLHRRSDYFSRPAEFVPDRWLPSSDLAFEHNPSAFMPFSQGPANCVGQHLARRQVQAVIILLLNTFEVRFAKGFDGAAWPESVCDFFTATRGPLLVELTPRV